MIATYDELDRARQTGDPTADALVSSLGREVWVVNAQLRHVRRNDERPELVPAVAAFLDDVASHAFDAGRVARAQAFASRHLLPITTSLFCASLPSAYVAAQGARVLVATGRMHGAELDRRVNETARFVLDVLAEGGFGPSGSAVRAIQKVRLMHAAVRTHLIETRAITDEVPINQEDLLGTLFTFSVVVLQSLRKLGVAVSLDEARDFYHLWAAVGAMLGISPALLPRELADAEDLHARIQTRQARASEHGRELMLSLLDGIERHVPMARWAPRVMIRHLIGHRLADLLGVPAADTHLMTLLPRPPRALARMAVPWLARPLLNGIVQWKLGAKTAEFQMPETATASTTRMTSGG